MTAALDCGYARFTAFYRAFTHAHLCRAYTTHAHTFPAAAFWPLPLRAFTRIWLDWFTQYAPHPGLRIHRFCARVTRAPLRLRLVTRLPHVDYAFGLPSYTVRFARWLRFGCRCPAHPHAVGSGYGWILPHPVGYALFVWLRCAVTRYAVLVIPLHGCVPVARCVCLRLPGYTHGWLFTLPVCVRFARFSALVKHRLRFAVIGLHGYILRILRLRYVTRFYVVTALNVVTGALRYLVHLLLFVCC